MAGMRSKDTRPGLANGIDLDFMEYDCLAGRSRIKTLPGSQACCQRMKVASESQRRNLTSSIVSFLTLSRDRTYCSHEYGVKAP